MLRIALYALLSCTLAFASVARAGGTAVEYYHAGFGHFFITAFADEAAALDANPASGWARTGATFAVETDPGAGLVPVCRFFSAAFAPKSSHFYTPYAAECDKVKANPTWTYESIAFYLRLPDATGHCPAGTTILYRLYNEGMTGAPNHRYTTSTAVFASLKAKGWIAEGDGTTGAFACTPAIASVAAGNVTGDIRLQPAVRTLTDAQKAELLTVTADTLTFAQPVGIAKGDVFVIDGVGAYLAVSVGTVGGRQVVSVLAPTMDELFAAFSLQGTVPTSALTFNAVNAPVPRSATDGGPVPKAASAVLSTYKGLPGIKASWTYEVPCTNGKMEVIAASLGLYGDIKIEGLSLTTLPTARLQAAYVVPEFQAKIGCKVTTTIPAIKLGTWEAPVPGFLGMVRIQMPLTINFVLQTDATPVVTLGLADAEFSYAPAGNPPWNSSVKGSLIGKDALVKVLAPSATYSWKYGAELDTSARIVAWTSYEVAGFGIAAGPQIDMQAVLGVSSEVCAKLVVATRFYVTYRKSRDVTKTDLFTKDFDTDQLIGTCAPSREAWHLTYESCVATPAGCGGCASGADLDMQFSADKTSVDQFVTGSPNIIYRLFNAPTTPFDYAGCGNASASASYTQGCERALLQFTFAADYKSGYWTQLQYGPSCTLLSTGTGVKR